MHGEKHKITSVAFLPNMHNLNLIIKKHHTKLNYRTFCKINWLAFNKTARVRETKKN